MEKLQKPVYQESDLSKADNNFLNIDQLKLMLAPTPADHIYQRPAKGGGKWSYVTGTYVKKKLNIMFGWNWDFEIIDEMIRAGQAIVKGRLTCRSNGQAIIKNQYGRQDIKFKKQYVMVGTKKELDEDAMKDSPIMLDLGNDLKGAATDALKKCASELGVSSDVYSPNEYKEIEIVEDAEPRNLDDLKKMVDMVVNIDELQILWSGLSKDEQNVCQDYMNLKKAEL